jgi:phosphopantothenate-cysteine ligase
MQVRHDWAPQAFLVSFKLETDPSILLDKARGAIRAYGVNAVVANELHSRYICLCFF